MKRRIVIFIDYMKIEWGGYQGPRPNEMEISVVHAVPTRSKDPFNLRLDLDLELEVAMYDLGEVDSEVGTFPP